jgi:indolepyruvate ferredoxin oxidoreductase beta subunit
MMNAENNHKSISFMLIGVGGQGTILASNVLAELGLTLGYDVKQAEVHGMSQRGGSVTSHVRWGERVFSPIITQGDADYLIAFEKSEIGRYMTGLKPGGLVLVNDYSIIPITVSSGGASYPSDDDIMKLIAQFTVRAYWVKGVKIAEELGNTRTANVVILGALSKLMDMEADSWMDVIKRLVPPKFIELNQKAFVAGCEVLTKVI